MEQKLELSADRASINDLRDRDETEGQPGSPSQTEARIPDPEAAPIKELTAYCKAAGNTPADWTKIQASAKRTAFRRLFCPEATEGFDPNDKLHLISERVENLAEKDLVTTVALLTENVGDTYFELGGVFSRVIAESWYREAGHENFKQWVAAVTDMKHAKARYLVQIYDRLNRLDIPWAKFSGIGWTKVRILLSVITAENVDGWVEKAREMTRVELKEAVKASGGERQGDGDGGSQTVNKGFRFHPDQMETVQQALEQMKGELPTDHDNVAMEHICAAYLTGQVGTDELRKLAQPSAVDSV